MREMLALVGEPVAAPQPGHDVQPLVQQLGPDPGSVGSPSRPKSPWVGDPIPTPRIRRPSLSRSSVAVSLASCHGRRRGTGVIIVPILIRLVLAATTASTSHGSTMGGPSPVLENTM